MCEREVGYGWELRCLMGGGMCESSGAMVGNQGEV